MHPTAIPAQRKANPAQFTANPAPRMEDPVPPAAAICPLTTPSEHHCVYCPTCSSRLQDSRCKLICSTCGYFLSCADFY